MKTLLSGLFTRKSDEARTRRPHRRGDAEATRQLERLEPRIALTIDLFAPSTARAGTLAPWRVIISDTADNVYVQQTASAPDNLMIADNSSFIENANSREISDINGTANGLQAVYATNGTRTFVESTDLVSGATPDLSLPVDGTPGGMVPGTLTGVLEVPGATFSPFVSFRMNNLFTPIGGRNQLFFGNENRPATAAGLTGVVVFPGTGTGLPINVTGVVDYNSGLVFLEFRNPAANNALFDAGGARLRFVSYAVYNQDVSASSFTLAPGLDFTRALFVDQLTPGSSININSPINQPIGQSAPAADLGLGSNSILVNATNINVNARVQSRAYFDVNINRGVAFSVTTRDVFTPTPVPESLNFNAAVAAPSGYSFQMGDDPSTLDQRKGRLFVSPTGSLSGAIAATGAAVTTPSAAVEVRADIADLIVEGTIFATSQTYVMRSTSASSDLAPFVFTTQSPLTGADTGLIRGTSVAVTLGNDMPTPEEEASAASILNLRTQIASMRITAATAEGKPLVGPYPYELTINELDSISFDAVAATGLPIVLSAAGTIDVTAALHTAGDLAINSGGAFTVSAPLSTWRGQVQITGPSLTVSNSVRVLDPVTDAFRTDIVLTATAGDLSLTGPVTAVNDVRLVQRNKTGTTGRLGGQTRVIARGIVVEAEGAADLKTDAVTFEGRSGGDFLLDELNDITITALRAPGFVTLSAGGVDPGADSPTTPNAIALTATLTDVTRFSASAPRGSVDVTNNVSQTMTLGDVTKIGAGTATSMQAAGSVHIRSTVGSLVVADAPLGGDRAVFTRVATTGDLGAAFAYNAPGTFASTLTGPKMQLLIDGLLMRVGDRVLVKDQSNPWENGIYAVTNPGNSGTAWRLTRTNDADTTAEFPAGSFVRVAEESAGGTVFTVAYRTLDDSPVLVNQCPISVAFVPNRADACRVRVATIDVLGGTYDATMNAIDALIGGPLTIDGVALNVGDRVLVRLGTTTGGAIANGVYDVVSDGSGGTDWRLERATDFDSGELIVSGYVATTEGSFRATTTGQAFVLTYDALGIDGVQTLFTETATTTNIGTDNPNATTTFVVSSTAGTNAAAGSLGKMIGLRLANDVSPSGNPDEVPAFTFAASLPGLSGAPAGVIRLAQELPAITKAFAIDGNARTALTGSSGTGASPKVVVDGSRITTTRFGNAVNPAVTEVDGFSFAPESGAVGTAAGASVANMTVGGFARGAAVKIDGASGILVRSMTLGRNETGSRLANLHGVRIMGNATGATVLGGTIVGGTRAGVSIEAGVTDYTVLGATIGAASQNNAVGIDSAGSGRIGVNPLQGVKAITQTTLGERTLTLPATVPVSGLYLGQSISGSGIPSGTTIAAIDGNTITLSAPLRTTSTATLTFGAPSRTVIEHNLTGVRLSDGSTTMTNTDVRRNTYDGIVINGVATPGGQHTLGSSTKVAATSNQITSNGRWGVNVIAADAGAATTLLNAQTIRGNVFAKLAPNKLGNIGVGTLAASTKAGGVYTPLSTTFDKMGNQHVKSTGASGSGGSGTSNNPYPWRSK
jgi:hypothetical protein